MNTTLRHSEHTDTVTGLPTRRAFAANLQRWLISQPDGTRYVVVHINLPAVRSQSGSKGIDGTLQDLLAYRAGILLTQHTRQSTLLGRSDRQSLLLAQACRHKKSDNCRAFVRNLLGNIGGLVDDANSILVTSLISSTPTLSANEVLRRLQFRVNAQTLEVRRDFSAAGLQIS